MKNTQPQVMYNEEQKRNFIKNYTSSQSTAKKIEQIFSWFATYEEKWGMDLAEQSVSELQPVVNSVSGVRTKSTETVLYILKDYVKWCLNNGYKASNGMFGVRTVATEKIREQMVSSPLHLKNILDGADSAKKAVNDDNKKVKKYYFDKAEMETVDITYRVFIWMAFAGLRDKDAVRVTSDCVDLKRLKINFEGESYELYKECIDDFEAACNLKDFTFCHGNYTTRRPRAEGDAIARGFISPIADIGTLRPLINKRFANRVAEKKDGKQKSVLSYNRIYMSGVFYRAFESECAGLPVDFSKEVAFLMQKKEQEGEQYTTKTRTLKSIANKFEREYREDYEKWKCAFMA